MRVDTIYWTPIAEVARILRISRATLYQRIRVGAIKTHKDGRRTFVTVEELRRYATPVTHTKETSKPAVL
jgi:excisionase family DNA binding protein